MMRVDLLMLLALTTIGAGCRPKTPCNPDFQIQIVVHPQLPINPDDDGGSLPTTMHLFELASEPSVMPELPALVSDAKGVLGEHLLREASIVLYPDEDHLQTVVPSADTRLLVLAAEFRRPIGSSWYSEYELPIRKRYEAAVCTAVKKKKPPLGDPCFLATVNEYNVDGESSAVGFGGAIPGSGCAPPPEFYEIDKKIARKRERERKRKRRFGRVADAVTPQAAPQPTTPQPTAPQPSLPQPSVPQPSLPQPSVPQPSLPQPSIPTPHP